LGGYKEGEFEEFHYKMVTAAKDKAGAIRSAKSTVFYRHTGFKSAPSHLDDKYGIDVDDAYEIKNILSVADRSAYRVILEPATFQEAEDDIHLGYFTIHSFK
jgi:hypothetical protein